MPSQFTPRSRKVRILATLGPASSSREMIAKLMAAGADAFRINMSHGGRTAAADRPRHYPTPFDPPFSMSLSRRASEARLICHRDSLGTCGDAEPVHAPVAQGPHLGDAGAGK